MKVQKRFKNMNMFGRIAGFSASRLGKQIVVPLLSWALLFAIWPQNASAHQDAPAPPQGHRRGGPPSAPAPPYTQGTPEQLQQLVAPIALYPDSLVAQILAASTFPEQVVEADRWVQEHQDLKGDALGQAVDQQPWDPSVKALTAFPSVLGNMDKNLSWTSSLGDAYYNQQQDVMDAVQVMRQRAEKAGDLKTTPQQVVTDARLDDQSFSLLTPRSFTSPRMIRGWFTEIPSWRGRDGTRIPEFGLAARTCRSGWALESASSEALDGAGITGDSIGVADSQLLAAAGTTPGATRFITGTASTEAGARAAEQHNRGARRIFQPFGPSGQGFQRKQAGGARIRCTSRTERHPLGRLQRHREGRTDKELFGAGKGQRQ